MQTIAPRRFALASGLYGFQRERQSLRRFIVTYRFKRGCINHLLHHYRERNRIPFSKLYDRQSDWLKYCTKRVIVNYHDFDSGIQNAF